MKVKCVKNKNNKFFKCDENSPLLKIGEEYEVEDVIVHAWHTEVYIVGFNVPFNSVCFGSLDDFYDF